MEEIKQKLFRYEEPEFNIVYLAETDIATLPFSEWEGEDEEGEFAPYNG